jgi:ferritin-like protein
VAKPWFDADTGVLKLDEYVAEMPSYQKIMADQVVTDEEVESHVQQVTGLLQRLDQSLPDDLKELATDALCKLAVLYALQRRRDEQPD